MGRGPASDVFQAGKSLLPFLVYWHPQNQQFSVKKLLFAAELDRVCVTLSRVGGRW
jgi:hypothetical protein